MRRLLPIVSVAIALGLAPCAAADTEPAALDTLVADAMKAFDVPGAAVVIVKDDKVIYLKGFGVREMGKSDPVTADTVFAIASCSKAFTAAGVAFLVGDGKMGWDDPVRKHVDWFRLPDAAADREVTIRDLLCHRTGMPRHDMLWAGTGISTEDYVRAYGKAKPATSFRSTWEYANVPFTTAGLASGNAAGCDWPTLMHTRIFEPLGMKTTYCSAREALANRDHAIPHNRHTDGKIGPVNRADVDSVRAAGSINSSVRDMAQWLRFQLADGRLDGKRLIGSAALKETRTAQMIVRQEGRWKIFFPEKSTSHLSYGLGWFVHDYRGHFACSHGGTLDGFRAQTVLVPDKKLGVVVFGNLTPSTFPEALSKTLLDKMLDLPAEDWNAFYLAQDRKTEADRIAAFKKRESERKPNTKPSRDLAAFAGNYSEPAYGQAEVVAGKDGLQLKWGRLTFGLEHHHFDTFTGFVSAPADEVIRNQRRLLRCPIPPQPIWRSRRDAVPRSGIQTKQGLAAIRHPDPWRDGVRRLGRKAPNGRRRPPGRQDRGDRRSVRGNREIGDRREGTGRRPGLHQHAELVDRIAPGRRVVAERDPPGRDDAGHGRGRVDGPGQRRDP